MLAAILTLATMTFAATVLTFACRHQARRNAAIREARWANRK